MPGRLDRVDGGIGDGVGPHDPDPVQLELVGRHVEADQGDDHLAGGRPADTVGADAGEDAVDRPLQAVTGDLEFAAALPEPD